jgi:hypothetical protein
VQARCHWREKLYVLNAAIVGQVANLRRDVIRLSQVSNLPHIVKQFLRRISKITIVTECKFVLISMQFPVMI